MYRATALPVLLGDGNGGFAPPSSSPFAVGNYPSSIASRDFNGDGKADLAITNENDNTVTVLLGDGSSGVLTPAPGSPINVGIGPVSVVSGDFNGDGKADLAIANITSSNVSILLGNGSGGFTAESGSQLPSGSSPVFLALGDHCERKSWGIQDAFGNRATASAALWREANLLTLPTESRRRVTFSLLQHLKEHATRLSKLVRDRSLPGRPELQS